MTELALVAVSVATVSLIVSLVRTTEPISAVLRRWVSRLSDAFWSVG